MPRRDTPLVKGEYYHIFNRGVEHRLVFTDSREYKRALIALRFYQHDRPPVKLSRYLKFSSDIKAVFTANQEAKTSKLVEIICFCLMPNHFHLLLRQVLDDGISEFIRRFEDSYTRYFNTKNNRDGPLLRGPFKAVRIATDEQLLHVSRYIHLNPYSSFVVKGLDELLDYHWSSLIEYLETQGGFGLCRKNIVLDFFKTREKYKKFVFNQADYQRRLENIKHLLFE